MANREKGEVSLEIDGKTYTLVLTTNAQALLEDVFSTKDKEVTFDEVMVRCQNGSIRAIRAIVWAALQAHHPTITLPQAGDLIQAAGGVLGLGSKLAALAGAVVPDPEDVATLQEGVQANPRTAQATRRGGTGRRSTVKPAASA